MRKTIRPKHLGMLRFSLLMVIWWPTLGRCQEVYALEKGEIQFRSEAPLELIQASSTDLRGLLKTDDGTFAFVVEMNAFEGFNSPLQQEHFCEKFMACHKFPTATFRGKLIEVVDFSQARTHKVRAKGKLVIHGIEQERIIRGILTIGPGGVTIDAHFQVPLEEHQINIPKIVNQNIAEQIEVSIHLELFPI